jgi:oxalate decarboxylase
MKVQIHRMKVALSRNTGDTDLAFLEMFASDEFMDVSLNRWIRRSPENMVKEHFAFDADEVGRIPSEKLAVLCG